MPTAKKRSFRPCVDSLDTRRLLSGGLHGGAVVHIDQVTDLKASPISKDIVAAVASSTASFQRKSISLDALKADGTSRKLSGSLAVQYKYGLFGTVTSNIQFNTSVDSPRPSDVRVALSKYSVFLGSKAKSKVGNAIANMIRRDHDEIVASFA